MHKNRLYNTLNYYTVFMIYRSIFINIIAITIWQLPTKSPYANDLGPSFTKSVNFTFKPIAANAIISKLLLINLNPC